MTAWIFDVDGTLTPSRGTMDPEFKNWFIEWQKSHNTYLVTGSDYAKTLEQLGPEIIAGCKMVFNCSGNEIRAKGAIIHALKWDPPAKLIAALEKTLEENEYKVRTGNHIEYRTGAINFSIVGRNANAAQREAYKKYDEEHADRINICLALERQFDGIDFATGGETGIDIYPTGKDKRQVLEWVKDKDSPIIFFGDKTLPGGNDYPLACSVDIAHRVEDWQHTWEILQISS